MWLRVLDDGFSKAGNSQTSCAIFNVPRFNTIAPRIPKMAYRPGATVITAGPIAEAGARVGTLLA